MLLSLIRLITESILLDYLKQFVADVKVVQLVSRNLSVPAMTIQQLLEIEICPKSIIVNWFFQP